MTAAQAAELLDLITARAPALRAVGLQGRVELGDFAFTLAPAEPKDAIPIASHGDDPDDMPRDPLRDPATHGLFGDDAPRAMPRRVRAPLIPEHDE